MKKRVSVKRFFDKESKVQQHQKDETNISKMVSKLQRGSEVPGASAKAQYMDISGLQTFQEAQNIVIAAKQQFMKIHPSIRRRFNNDPSKLISFLGDNKNRSEAIKLGLIPKPPIKREESPPQPPAAPVVDPPKEPDSGSAGGSE